MKTVNTVVNAATLLGSGVVGIAAAGKVYHAVKDKKYAAVAIGSLTVLIAVAAFRFSLEKLNDGDFSSVNGGGNPLKYSNNNRGLQGCIDINGDTYECSDKNHKPKQKF